MRTPCLLTISQHALCRGMYIPACTGQGVCVSQHAMGRGGVWQGCLAEGCLPVGVCPGGCLFGGVCPGGCLPRGVSAQGVCLPRGGVSAQGVSAQGCVCPGVARHPPVGVSAQGLPDTPCEQNDWQTGVKTLPCRNFVAGGNYHNLLGNRPEDIYILHS